MCWLSSCAAVQVRIEHLRGTNFRFYRTFRVAEGRILLDEHAVTREMTEDQIARVISNQLQLIGLSEDGEHPDLLIRFIAAARTPEGLAVEELGGQWSGHLYRSWWARPSGGSGQFLALELLDGRTEQPVWRAVCQAPYTDVEDFVREAVTRAFARYPP